MPKKVILNAIRSAKKLLPKPEKYYDTLIIIDSDGTTNPVNPVMPSEQHQRQLIITLNV